MNASWLSDELRQKSRSRNDQRSTRFREAIRIDMVGVDDDLKRMRGAKLILE